MTTAANPSATTTFSECFWKFIKENVGITKIYPAVSSHRQQKNRKVPSFEERQERIDRMLLKTDKEDDKLSTNDASLSSWSPDAVRLARIIKQLGIVQDVCVEDYILGFFGTMSIQERMLRQLDPTLARFQHLKVLNLSFNQIERIEFLPPNLEELYLNGNQVSEVALSPGKPLLKLIHLGLNMNKIR
mmetsp:Transcript_17877/g.30378  ORF Transcript_17877/g.30378 Transcript_17877/m.30378 type:complete len:188 (+) Transcript_17877:19-582(+)